MGESRRYNPSDIEDWASNLVSHVVNTKYLSLNFYDQNIKIPRISPLLSSEDDIRNSEFHLATFISTTQLMDRFFLNDTEISLKFFDYMCPMLPDLHSDHFSVDMSIKKHYGSKFIDELVDACLEGDDRLKNFLFRQGYSAIHDAFLKRIPINSYYSTTFTAFIADEDEWPKHPHYYVIVLKSFKDMKKSVIDETDIWVKDLVGVCIKTVFRLESRKSDGKNYPPMNLTEWRNRSSSESSEDNNTVASLCSDSNSLDISVMLEDPATSSTPNDHEITTIDNSKPKEIEELKDNHISEGENALDNSIDTVVSGEASIHSNSHNLPLMVNFQENPELEKADKIYSIFGYSNNRLTRSKSCDSVLISKIDDAIDWQEPCRCHVIRGLENQQPLLDKDGNPLNITDGSLNNTLESLFNTVVDRYEHLLRQNTVRPPTGMSQDDEAKIAILKGISVTRTEGSVSNNLSDTEWHKIMYSPSNERYRSCISTQMEHKSVEEMVLLYHKDQITKSYANPNNRLDPILAMVQVYELMIKAKSELEEAVKNIPKIDEYMSSAKDIRDLRTAVSSLGEAINSRGQKTFQLPSSAITSPSIEQQEIRATTSAPVKSEDAKLAAMRKAIEDLTRSQK